MSEALSGVAQAVMEAQRSGQEPDAIAAQLVSFAAGYALAIGWDADSVAKAQAVALDEHQRRRRHRA